MSTTLLYLFKIQLERKCNDSINFKKLNLNFYVVPSLFFSNSTVILTNLIEISELYIWLYYAALKQPVKLVFLLNEITERKIKRIGCHNSNNFLCTYIFISIISKMRYLIQVKCLPVNTGRFIFSGQLVSRYHGQSCPLTMACILVVAATWLYI